MLKRYHRTSFTVSNLIVGNSYAFRVFAENQCGLSETAPITADLAHIQKAGRARELGRVEAEVLKRGGDLGHYIIGPLVHSATVCKTEGFAQRDFSEAPKFTQPLADCTTVTGYDTQLFCCVRASPKVSGVPRAGRTALLPAPALTPTVWKCILTTPLFPSPPLAPPTAGEVGYAQSGHAESKAG